MKPNASLGGTPLLDVSAFQMYSNSQQRKRKRRKKTRSSVPPSKPQSLAPPHDNEVIEIFSPEVDRVGLFTNPAKKKKYESTKASLVLNGSSISAFMTSLNVTPQNGSPKKLRVGRKRRRGKVNVTSSVGKHEDGKKRADAEERSSAQEDEPSSVGKDEGGKKRADVEERSGAEENVTSSIENGRSLLSSLIAPMELDEFFKSFWEKRALVVKRDTSNYFDLLDLSSTSLDAMLRKNHLRFTKNIDITSYKHGKRATLNPSGRAMPAEVWDYYNEGCSVRWLNPQTYSARLWNFCASLQEYFGCFVGANMYLTPANSQGFAPHYDDIEAFILQLEGKKQWKLYTSSLSKDVLPRFSSGDYKADSMGKPYLEVTLEAGDLLYFPRGTIHEAVAASSHSLHVTLSCYQRNSWADLLETMIPQALSRAIAEDPLLRTGLPIGHLNYAGCVTGSRGGPDRKQLEDLAADMVARVLARVDLDLAVDTLAKRFMQDALPPSLTDAEKKCSMHEDGDRMSRKRNGQLISSWAMDSSTMIRLTRAHCTRLVFEAGAHHLYYTLDNTREYHEVEPGFFEITPVMVPCVELLVQAYPQFIAVDSLPLPSLETKVEFAGQLWIKGLLMTNAPLADEPNK